jgi:hypothetical protein
LLIPKEISCITYSLCSKLYVTTFSESNFSNFDHVYKKYIIYIIKLVSLIHHEICIDSAFIWYVDANIFCKKLVKVREVWIRTKLKYHNLEWVEFLFVVVMHNESD